jgi:hypothetical protein
MARLSRILAHRLARNDELLVEHETGLREAKSNREDEEGKTKGRLIRG